jgi:hypothetical protein
LNLIDSQEAGARIKYFGGAGVVHGPVGGSAAIADHFLAQNRGHPIVYHLPGLLNLHGLSPLCSWARAALAISASRVRNLRPSLSIQWPREISVSAARSAAMDAISPSISPKGYLVS